MTTLTKTNVPIALSTVAPPSVLRRRMTIAAGFKCANGAILFADTEVSLSSFKVSGPKAYVVDEGPLKMGIVGAGRTDSVMYAIQRIAPQMAGITDPDIAVERIERQLREIYEHHIFPDPNGKERTFDLIIGMWSEAQKVRLFKTDRTMVVEIERYDAMGTGWELASYLLDQLYDKDSLSTGRGVALATHVLQQVKKYIQACGGESHIIRLHRQGEVRFTSLAQIEDQERFFSAYQKTLQPVMFAGIDLEVTQTDFCEQVAKAAQTLETLRSNAFVQAQQIHERLEPPEAEDQKRR